MDNNNEETIVPNYEGEAMKMPENTAAAPTTPVKESTVINGPLLAILAILLILILGGMYYWFSTLTAEIPAPPVVERPTPEQNNEPESTTAEVQTEVMQTTSTSDELGAIEADLEATNLDSLNSEMNAIDAELNAALQ